MNDKINQHYVGVTVMLSGKNTVPNLLLGKKENNNLKFYSFQKKSV